MMDPAPPIWPVTLHSDESTPIPRATKGISTAPSICSLHQPPGFLHPFCRSSLVNGIVHHHADPDLHAQVPECGTNSQGGCSQGRSILAAVAREYFEDIVKVVRLFRITD